MIIYFLLLIPPKLELYQASYSTRPTNHTNLSKA
jgi:hypothetical protein